MENGAKPNKSDEKVLDKLQLEQQIVDYYSTTDRYIRSGQHSNAHQTVFVKEHDRYQWIVLEQKSQVEVRQTDRHGEITAWDDYELTRNLPKCVGVGHLCEDGNMQIHFNADEINLIYQFGEQGKAETCANLSEILPHIKDGYTKQIVSTTLEKLSALSEESCTELTATTERRKLTDPKSYVSYRKPRTVSVEQRERARQMMIERNREKEV